MGRRLPFLSLVLMPRNARALLPCFVGARKPESIARIAVPACEPFTPALLSTPIMALVSSSEMPALWAVSPAYLSASPISVSPALELFAVLISTSPMRPVWSAERPNCDMVAVVISADVAIDSRPAFATSSSPGMASIIWAALSSVSANDVARMSMPSAACDADAHVVAPRSRAC